MLVEESLVNRMVSAKRKWSAMPSVKIECPKCRRLYKVDQKVLGRKVTCATETCGATFLAAAMAPLCKPVEDVAFLSDDASQAQKPPRESSDQTAPPPLRKRRKTGAGLPLIAVAAIVFGVFIVFVIGIRVASDIGKSHDLPQKLANENGQAAKAVKAVEADPAREQMIDMLFFTDTTLRLMKETSDAELAREYIDKWTAMRTSLQRTDSTETSLGVIQGHLDEIYNKLYPRTAEWRAHNNNVRVFNHGRIAAVIDVGWRDRNEWLNNRDSEKSIRAAESQIMRSFKITWKESQKPKTFLSKYTALQDECKRIAAMSKPGRNGLPERLGTDEASKLIRGLEILYADIPFRTDLSEPFSAKQANEFKFPDFEMTKNLDVLEWYYRYPETERSCFALAGYIVYHRSEMPRFEDDLEGKTELLKFSESYIAYLGYLESAARR